MDYVLDIKPLEDAGKTDAEIADLLSSQTQTDMPNSVLRKYLHKNDLWLVDPATGLHLAGAIGSAYNGLTSPQKAAVRKLQMWVYQQESIETENDLDVALEFKTIINTMVTLGIITGANRTAIGLISGGLKHGIQTAQNVTDARNTYNATVAATAAEEARRNPISTLRASLMNEIIAPAEVDGVSTVEDVKASIIASLS